MQWIDAIFGFVAFLAYGENAECGDGFKGVRGLWMQHTHTNRDKVADVDQRNRRDNCEQDAFRECLSGTQYQSEGFLPVVDNTRGLSSLNFQQRGYGFSLSLGTSVAWPILMVDPNRL